MVTRSLNIITVINGIVQVEEDVERQSRNYIQQKCCFFEFDQQLKKKNSPNSDVQILIKNKLRVRAKEYQNDLFRKCGIFPLMEILNDMYQEIFESLQLFWFI